MGKCWAMFRSVFHIFHGAFLWQILRMRFGLDNGKAVLFLTGDNQKLDYFSMVYLQNFMEQKYVDGAVLFVKDKRESGLVRKIPLPGCVRCSWYSSRKMRILYDYYSFHKFSDKVIFTYTDLPGDNQLGRALRETKVNEEDAVCLGLYHLRRVPGAHLAESNFQTHSKTEVDCHV